MAPLPPTKHSRTARSAKNPRGIYAPPSTLASEPSPADLHTGPSTSLKRKRAPAEVGEDPFAEFRVNKKDKRAIRHQTLLAKVREGGVKKMKRRRPGKKLRVGLGGLGEALPEMEEVSASATDVAGGRGGEDGEEGWEGVSEDGDGDEVMMAGLRKAKRGGKSARESKTVMQMKSLKHRPGAMKRKRVMEGKEMERFGRNLAQMVGRWERPVEAGAEGGGGRSGGEGGAGGGASEADRWAALRKFIGGTMEKNEGFGKG